MLRYLLPLLMLALIVPVSSTDPIPPGTEFGRAYVRVTDCLSGSSVVGASVNLDNPTHRTSSVTNSTGYAEVSIFAWFYNYYVTASGYRIEAGLRKFSLGEVFQVCLIPEGAGFWRVVASVLSWQGDIHAGGSGWAVIRLKNLESGVFNITELQIWVAGYDGPAITYSIPSGIVLGRFVDRDINMTVRPRADVPVGRLKAELKFRAVFTGEDGRTIGPLTVSTDLDYVVISPYRTIKVLITDYWGLNPLPEAIVEMQSTLLGATSTFLYKSDKEGYIEIKRMNDGAYFTRILYLSPYDAKVHLVNQFYPILADLARNPVIRSHVFEVHAKLKDLANRPLEAEIHLNNVKTVSKDGLGKFINVPPGTYRFKASWMGVDVFESDVKVDEPLVKGSPGGYIEAVAAVGDLRLRILSAEKKDVEIMTRVKITPLNLVMENTSSPVFTKLPRGSYRIEIHAYNIFKKEYVPVGETILKIPENHGENIVTVRISDIEIIFTDQTGRRITDATVSVEHVKFSILDGKISLKSVPEGPYRLKVEWKGFTVLDTVVLIQHRVKTEFKVEIYPMQIRVVGIDGKEIQQAKAVLKYGPNIVEKAIVAGYALFEEVPSGLHLLTIYLDGVEVFSGEVRTAMSTEVMARAGYIELVVKDQRGTPLANVLVEVERAGSNITNVDGVAKIGQKPLGEYRYSARFRNLKVLEGFAKAGERTEITLPLYSLKVVLVNEFDTPVQGIIEVHRDDISFGRYSGSDATFTLLPPGPYLLRASVGTKHIEQQITLTSDGQVFTITMPVAIAFGNIVMSTRELVIIILPVMLAVTGLAISLLLQKSISYTKRRVKGRV